MNHERPGTQQQPAHSLQQLPALPAGSLEGPLSAARLDQQGASRGLGGPQAGPMPPHEPSAALTPTEPLEHVQKLKAVAGSTLLAAAGVMQAPQNGLGAPTAAQAVDGPPTAAHAPPTAVQSQAGAAPPTAQQQQQQQQRQQQTAGVATPAAHVAAAATPAASPPQPLSPGERAQAELEAILARVAQLDPDGWFKHPVREADAPNYYKIIRRPMCFEVRAPVASDAVLCSVCLLPCLLPDLASRLHGCMSV